MCGTMYSPVCVPVSTKNFKGAHTRLVYIHFNIIFEILIIIGLYNSQAGLARINK